MKSFLKSIGACVIVAVGLAATAASAQTYPAKPIKLIVAYGPGSGADVMARILAEHLQGPLKTSVVVENKEGAGGAIGTLAAARSSADGYTILLAPTTLTVSPHMQSTPQYDPVKDFTPIMRVAVLPMTVVTSSEAPYKSLKELIDYAKANPGKLNYATSGKGSPSHLEVELLRKRYGLDVRDVPYRTGGQAMTDLISGQVSFYFPVLPAAQPQIDANRIRALAIGSPTRSDKLPSVPTIGEALDLPGYEASVWYGFLAPAGVPKEVVDRLEQETAKVLESPEVRQKIANTGSVVAPMSSGQFAKFIGEESAKWGGLVKDLGLKGQ